MTGPAGPVSPNDVLALQRSLGNVVVARMLAAQREALPEDQDFRQARRSAVEGVLSSSGKPLAEPVRREMESRIGADFSNVRVHADSAAHTAAESVRAQAFTSGSHLVFQRGQYNPASTAGKHVLAHELTHVVQQRSGPVAGADSGDGLHVSDPSDAYERAAEANAARVMNGPAPVQREHDDAAQTVPDRVAEAETVAGQVTRRATTAAMSASVQRAEEVEQEPGPTWGPGVIQRLVGFEFEDANWRPWRRLRRDHGTVGRILRGARSRVPGLDDDTAVPAERHLVLHRGTNFRLEADDTPGPTRSNIEFVTEPFDETDAGVAALRATMADIAALLGRIDRFAGRRGPDGQEGPPYPVTERDYKEHYVRHGEHQLSGSTGIEAKDVLLSGGTPGGALKMQATSGVPLADLPAMLERLGREVPNETPEEVAARNPERQLIQDLEQPNEPLMVQGKAPSLARQVLRMLRNDPAMEEALTGDTAQLTGFLAAVILSMKLLRRPGGRGTPIKYRLTFLPRNTFAQMFAALPPDQQDALRGAPDSLIAALLNVSNASPLLKHGSDRELSPASSLIGPNPGPIQHLAGGGVGPGSPSGVDTALATVTIQDWITGIIAGRDYLTPGEMDRWLTGRDQVSETDRRDAASALESFGTAPTLDTRDTGEQLALFEIRSIAPLGPTENLTLEQATDYAIRLLSFYQQLRNSRAAS